MATVSLQSAFDAARRALDAGAAMRAAAIVRYILEHFPRNIEAQRLLGEALLNLGDVGAAVEAFEHVLDADPESVAAHYGRGLALTSLGDRSGAIRAFERALEIQPNLAELRTQLIRLYGEAPGTTPQLRLSRAGLARLYTRGGMYGQAVDEFRAVLEADPARPDLEAALAEALWRDGQEDEAAAYCRTTLEHRPELLKPRLLLGYLMFAGGQPEGEELWRAAAQQDPTLAVARSLFDIQPPIRLDEPVLPAFDADELLARRDAAPAAPEPAEDDELVARAPVEAAAPASSAGAETLPAPQAADTTRSKSAARIYERDSWLDDVDELPAPVTAAAAPAPPRDMLSDDALLASLLGIDEQEQQPEQEQPTPLDAQAQGEAESIEDAAPAFSPEQDEDGEAALFVAEDDLALDAELDALPAAGTATADDRPIDDLGPFSLDELGFDGELDDEIDAPPATAAATTLLWEEPDTEAYAIGESTRSDESDVAPFDELPLSEQPPDVAAEEPAALARLPEAPLEAEPTPDPGATRDVFSLDDLADDAPSWEQSDTPTPAGEEQVPFSLADLGIDAEQLNAVREPEDETLAGWSYAPLPAPSVRSSRAEGPSAAPLEDVAGSARDVAAPEDSPRAPAVASATQQVETSPFSLADLGLTDEEIAALDLADTDLGDDQESRAAEPQPAAPAAPQGLSSVFQQLDAEPENASLRLAVARISSQSGAPGQALEHYRQLVRRGHLLGDVAGDLEDLVNDTDEPQQLRRLHRLLGDTYMKQNRVQEALDQYSWTADR